MLPLLHWDYLCMQIATTGFSQSQIIEFNMARTVTEHIAPSYIQHPNGSVELVLGLSEALKVLPGSLVQI